MNRAAEVGNKSSFTRTVKNYADTVVHQAGQAVAEGAKIIQDRIGARNIKSLRQTVKRLEDAAVTCTGLERVQLLRRWLAVLQEIEKPSAASVEDENKNVERDPAYDESRDSPRRSSTVLYYDPDSGDEPMNFHGAFLHSQALEGITLSMILEAPSEQEVPLLLEMFGLCLTGGKEIHNAIVSSIQDLAKAYSNYEDEVLAKREELLQFARAAITGLKINADIGRIDAQASTLKKKLEGMTTFPIESHEKTPEKTTTLSIEALKKALEHVRACSRLEGLLLNKKMISNGDSPDIHAQKVDKLKVLSESLASSTTKAEKGISDNRIQKEEALKFRVTKSNEVNEVEKDLAAEIAGLEKQRDGLEAELKKVNISLSAARARLHNTIEERDQFYDANDQIVAHLKTKEDELSRSIASCRVEADVLKTWINFLEDTWVLQCSYSNTKENQINDELNRHQDYFVNLAIKLLSAYKEELQPPISRIGKFVENLKTLGLGSELPPDKDNEDSKALNPRKNLEEEYLAYETEIIITFSVVDNIKEQFYAQKGKISRKDDSRVKELFDDIEKLRAEFEAIERPNLEMETPTPKAVPPVGEKPTEGRSSSAAQSSQLLKVEEAEHAESAPIKAEKLDPEAELAKFESEFGKVAGDYTAEEIGGWEFDELERELRSGDSRTNNSIT